MADVFNTVVPVFVLILLGYGAGKAGWFVAGSARGLSLFVFAFAIPALLFRAMASFGLPAEAPWALWGAYYGAVAVIWLIAIVLSTRIRSLRGAGGAAAAIGAGFGNTVMLGLPLGLAHFGEKALLPMALIVSIHLPVQWLAAVLIARAAARHENGSTAEALLDAAKTLAGNPIIIAIIAGVLWNLSGLAIPQVVETTIELLAKGAVPAALFALGLSLSRFGFKGQWSGVGTLLVLKLALMPLVAWWLAGQVFGLSGIEAAVVVFFAALPSGANAYLFVERYKVAEAAVTGAIAVGTAISVLTLSFVLAQL